MISIAMTQALKKYFIPHEGNEYQPHILRWKSACAVGCLLLAAEVVFLGQRYIVVPQTNIFADIVQSVLVSQTNENRIAVNENALRVSPLLQRAADLKAEDMAARGYFAHTSPDGLAPWYWLEKVGYGFSAAGENLAVNFSDSADVMNAWLASPDHRANILNDNFSEVGIGTARGDYEGHRAVFVVQFFGTPSVASVAARAPVLSVPPQDAVRPAGPARIARLPLGASSSAVVSAGSSGVASVLGKYMPSNPVSSVAGSTSPWAQFISSPRRAVNDIFLALGAFMALALGLNIFIKIRIQRLRVILNGAALLALAAGFLWLNNFALLPAARIF